MQAASLVLLGILVVGAVPGAGAQATVAGERANPRFDRAIANSVRLIRDNTEANTFYEQGVASETGRGGPPDLAQALAWYGKAAQAGQPDAMLALGQFYHEGRGVGRDLAEAASWYRQAAHAGVAVAQYNLAVMLAAGDGVPQDLGEAAAWYQRAAAQGHGRAQFNLAVLLAQGQGGPADVEQAYKWFSLAGLAGIDSAQGQAAALAARMSAEQLARAGQLVHDAATARRN
jgi:TPR repeat protein